jgi:4-amino-4-deoxy-L-arabinose transferase-like glycosyltransferase
MIKKMKKEIWLVVGIALLTRLVFGVIIFLTGFQVRGDEIFQTSESGTYTYVAHNLVRFHEFTTIGPGHPSAFRTPVYPILLAVNYLFFGDNHIAIIVLQIVFSVLTALAVYLAARELVSDRAALFAGLGYAFLVSPLTYTFLVGTETLFSFLLMYFFLYCLKMIREPQRMRWTVLAGVTLGLAVLTRPIAVYLIAMPVGILIWRGWPISRRTMVRSVIVVGIFMFVMSPWLARNQMVFGYPGLSTITGTNLWFYYYGSLKAYRSGLERDDVIDELKLNDVCDGCGIPVESSFQRSRELSRRGLIAIVGDPFGFAFLVVRGGVFEMVGYTGSELRYLLSIPYQGSGVLLPASSLSLAEFLNRVSQNLSRKLDVVLVFLLQQLPLFLLAVIGTYRNWRDPVKRGVSLVTLGIILYLIFSPAIMAFPRYVIPAHPLACVLAAFALPAGYRSVKES